MRSNTFRQHRSASFAQRPPLEIGQWFHRNRRTIFMATMRSAVYSTSLVAAYHTFTGGLSVYIFLKESVFPIFQELM
ncbi:hypothetical protein [Chamaesiphon sp.]|uniref:hypothetical protein n=1 Tax=Chamaesiphon sp. TaxID=2814140 RepID=UPI003593D7C8